MNNFIDKSHLKFLFFMFIFAAAMPLFAENLNGLGLGKLETLGQNIQDIFTGKLVRIILTCCLCGCGVAYAYNKDNEKMKMKVIAIFVGIAIITVASFLVEKLMA